MTSSNLTRGPLLLIGTLVACNRAAPPQDSELGSKSASSAMAESTTALADSAKALSDSAKIDMATARRTALAKVPNGKVLSEELEQEGGRLVFSFDIRPGSSKDIEEVQIDARDGSVVSMQRESPAQQAEEARQDQKSRQ